MGLLKNRTATCCSSTSGVTLCRTLATTPSDRTATRHLVLVSTNEINEWIVFADATR